MDNERDLKIGQRLRVLRNGRQLKQKDLAKLSGIAAPTISKIEKGFILDPKASILKALEDALSCEHGMLYGDIDVKADRGIEYYESPEVDAFLRSKIGLAADPTDKEIEMLNSVVYCGYRANSILLDDSDIYDILRSIRRKAKK